MTGLPFLERFHTPIRTGQKTATSRTKAYGKPGDVIRTPAGWIRLIDVMQLPLREVRDGWWRQEGCTSPDEFAEIWKQIHPRAGFDENQVVHLHLFELVGGPVMNLDRLEALAKRASPGPWQWWGNLRSHIYLGCMVAGQGRTTVMDFARMGMRDAQPRFSVHDLMVKAQQLAVRDVPYRDDIVDIDHPDAQFIAAANPLTVQALIAVARAARAYIAEPPFAPGNPDARYAEMSAALAVLEAI